MSKTKVEKLPKGVRMTGNGSLVVAFDLPNGQRVRRSLGQDVSTKEAEQALAVFKAQVRAGTYEPPQPKGAPVRHTVASLWEPYLATYRNRSGKGEWRLQIAWAHLRPHFEAVRIENLSTV